jgi:hypothetical protein
MAESRMSPAPSLGELLMLDAELQRINGRCTTLTAGLLSRAQCSPARATQRTARVAAFAASPQRAASALSLQVRAVQTVDTRRRDELRNAVAAAEEELARRSALFQQRQREAPPLSVARRSRDPCDASDAASSAVTDEEVIAACKARVAELEQLTGAFRDV